MPPRGLLIIRINRSLEMGKLISLNGRVICIRLAKSDFANRLGARAEEGAFQNGNGPWEDGGTEVMGHGSLRSQLSLN